jgi:hypothetical protein
LLQQLYAWHNQVQSARNNLQNNSISEGYKALFRNFSGRKSIIMAAASTGEASLSHLQYGALYGILFRHSLSEGVKNGNPTWESVLANAKELTYQCSQAMAQQDPTGKSSL